MGAPRTSAAAEACSEEGLFIVFPAIAEPSLLRPPIDWTQNPFASQSWCAQLHTLRFLGVLISRYRTNGDLQALVSACKMALDWVAANPRGAPDLSEMAWSDKVAGDRAPFLSYLLRSAAVEGLLTDEQLTTLFDAVLDHAEFLYDDANYTAVSNHGLYQDVGLVLLSSYVDFLPQAVEWRRRGVERFRETLTKHVASGGEGVHLEHSPAYQWLMVGLVRRFRELADFDDERLLAMLGELEEAAGWLVLPDGSTPPLGDSDMLPAPLWAQDAAHRCVGLRVFRRAGIASVRTEESMLIVSAGYHTHTHKHADELGFCLFDNGTLLMAEAGKYGYDKQDPARTYALSSQAHSVLIVDGESFMPLSIPPYGGALSRVGEGAGWFAVEGSNPLLTRQAVEHHRLFVYRPGVLLVIVDRVESPCTHEYMRLFHFAPGVTADLRPEGKVEFEAGGITGMLRDQSAVKVDAALVEGQRGPDLSGWCFPSYRDWQPVPTLALTASGENLSLITLVSLAEGSATCDVRISDDGIIVADPGSGQDELRITRRGSDALEIVEGARAT
jgi:Heparinase II/III-like protein/Heparinase II/III N-terminus